MLSGLRGWSFAIAMVAIAGGCATGEGGEAETEPGTLMSATEGASSGDTSTSTIPASTSGPSSTTTSTTADDSASGGEGSSGGCTAQMWWPDDDGDGYGAAAGAVSDCEQPAGYADNDQDCDDQDEARNPGLTETCDGVDNDCDDLRDEYSDDNTSCNGCELFEEGGHSYAVCELSEQWSDARSSCGALFSGDLLVLDDGDESDAIVAFLGALPNASNYWMGLSDVAVEGQFVWIDGSEPTFTNWADQEPNDLDGEDCGEVRASYAFAWNDQACSDPQGFVCESPAP